MPEPLHLLVVEDEVLAAMAIEDYLSRQGYRVTLAGDGLEALERYRNDPPDAVITDLRMPRMDGRQLIRELRRSGADLPIVVMTGFLTLDDDGNGGGLLPDLEVLRKPVSPQVILETVRRALDRRQ